MATLDVYNTNREKVSQIDVEDAVFDAQIKEHLFYDVVRMQLAGRRRGTADTKTRSEVRGGGRKPWRQKGTGRARAGTIRSPLWKGGGVVFGPKPRDYTIKVNKKVRKLALCSLLTKKIKENSLLVVDKIDIADSKTKELKNILDKLETQSVLIVDEENSKLMSCAQNISDTKVVPPEGFNLYDALYYKDLVITEQCVEKIQRRLLI